MDLEARYQDPDAGTDVEWIPIAELELSHSPRSAGESDEHIRVLAQSQAELPPIVVQRGTNRVVDGVHRVRAAQLRGEREIRARLFDGDDASAFVLAVRLNVRHGLPLSLADRKTAAGRILREQADWSNRKIASAVGLSPKTVATLREAAGRPGGPARIGRDGRVRPVSAAAGRERAREVLLREPSSSLRAVSAVAGVSAGTVRDVRERLRQETGAVVPGPRRAAPVRGADVPRARPAVSGPKALDRSNALLRSLRTDPSLRFNQSGRLMLSILAVAAMDPQTQDSLVLDLPDHCIDFVAELAKSSVLAWQDLEARLSQRRSAPPARKECAVNPERRGNYGP
ncbi:ParB/RepB/Spo0J family partition protein [Streptacidiphilus sp. N1-3]|uniref:ParB/RepB/Spo0J family partition protein n=1 Tax=Streptacidiphilus alkalitolerans TaxID=3342712 RepID=A0ABV6XDW8_9ACTN